MVKAGVELLCQRIKAIARSLQKWQTKDLRNSISDEIGGMEEEEEAGNIGSEHESVSSECKVKDQNCKGTDVERDDGNGEQKEKQMKLHKSYRHDARNL
jgi:hypothetical protein